MKHLMHTHLFLSSACQFAKALPSTTPFFDLATHKQTPHGKTTPHLVVKCGENHTTALLEILSTYVDGHQQNTALFVASQALKSMTQEEFAHMFHTHHTQFIDSIQRLVLYPKVVNIDRERTERYNDNNEIT